MVTCLCVLISIQMLPRLPPNVSYLCCDILLFLQLMYNLHCNLSYVIICAFKGNIWFQTQSLILNPTQTLALAHAFHLLSQLTPIKPPIPFPRYPTAGRSAEGLPQLLQAFAQAVASGGDGLFPWPQGRLLSPFKVHCKYFECHLVPCPGSSRSLSP